MSEETQNTGLMEAGESEGIDWSVTPELQERFDAIGADDSAFKEALGSADEAPKETEETTDETTETPAEGENKDESQDEQPPKGEDSETKELTKEEKEHQRKDKSWAKLNADKEDLKQREAKVKEREDALEARLKSIEEKMAQPKDEPKLTAEQCDVLSQKYEESGNFEMAEFAKKEANRLRLEQQSRPAEKSPEFVRLQQSWWDRAKADVPNIAVKDTDENRAFKRILATEPWLMDHPRGPFYLAQFVKAQAGAAQASRFSDENASLKSELEKLRKATAPSRPGTAASPVSNKRFEDMSLEDQQKALRRMAAAATDYRQ